MIVVIDGTGPDSESTYSKEMRTSFCNQISNQVIGARYHRGPTLLGFQTSTIAEHAAADALVLKKKGQRVILAGYSRGGCAAIRAAEHLREKNVRVDSLFLFDAVDMDYSSASQVQTIPDNVSYVAHARSARDLAFWAKNPVKSRFYFYNTGRWLAGSGTLEERSFIGTHGAVGGVPWADIAEDLSCARAVAEWMTPRIRGHGVAVTLSA